MFDGKKIGNNWEIDLSKYKILGTGEITIPLIIKAKEASKSAIEKIEKAGGKIILARKKKKIDKRKEKIGKEKN